MWLGGGSLLLLVLELFLIWQGLGIVVVFLCARVWPLALWLLFAAWRARRELRTRHLVLACALAAPQLVGSLLYLVTVLFAATY